MSPVVAPLGTGEDSIHDRTEIGRKAAFDWLRRPIRLKAPNLIELSLGDFKNAQLGVPTIGRPVADDETRLAERIDVALDRLCGR